MKSILFTKSALVFYAFFLWFAALILSLKFDIEWLFGVCVLIGMGTHSWACAAANISEREVAEQDVKDYGEDWAVKEIVSNPGMSKHRLYGLRSGIKNQGIGS